MCLYSKVHTAPPTCAGLFVKRGRGAPLLAGSTGKKARGVYLGGDEATCGNGPSYFTYLTSSYTSLLSYLRDGSETNTRTLHMNYCVPHYNNNLPTPLNSSETYTVTDYIISSQNILNGHEVRYEAGSYIELIDGFTSGTDFIAEIDPCVITRTEIAAKTEDVYEKPEQVANSVSTNNIKIYPTVVASGNAINVEVTEATENLQMVIYDLQGKRILQTTLHNLSPNAPISILLNNTAAGFYLVRAEGATISITQKIIVK